LPPSTTPSPYTTLFRSLFLSRCYRQKLPPSLQLLCKYRNKSYENQLLTSACRRRSVLGNSPRAYTNIRLLYGIRGRGWATYGTRSEEHTSELQSRENLV